MKSKQAFVFRLLALVISVLLVFGALPVSALDGEESTEYGTETVAEEATEPESDVVPESTIGADDTIVPVGGETETQPVDDTTNNPEDTPMDATEAPTEEPTVAPTEEPTEPPVGLADGYYLIGQNGWSVDSLTEEQLFVKNEAATNGEYLLRTKLTKDQTIKVVEVKDEKIAEGDAPWFPSGEGNEYKVDEYHEGNVIIYFNPVKPGKDDWEKFGGYMFIPNTKKENDEDPEPEVIEEDNDAPELSIAGYAYGTDAQWNNETWKNGQEAVNVILNATDKGWGVNSNLFKKNGNKVKVAPQGESKYFVELSTKDKIKTASADFVVSDVAGHKSNTVSTQELKIDNVKPKADDIEFGRFEDAKNSLEAIMNAVSFGLYHNKDISFVVRIKHNNGAPIVDAKLYNGADESTIEGTSNINEEEHYTEFTFTLPINNDKGYKLSVYDIKDGAGNILNDKISITDFPLSTTTPILADSDLFEVVVKDLEPAVEYEITGPDKVNDVYLDTFPTIKVDIEDAVAGVADINAYFDLYPNQDDVSKMKSVPFKMDGKEYDGSYKFDPKEHASKITKRTVDIVLPEDISSGCYGVMVVASSLAGNVSASAPQKIMFDKDKPVFKGDYSVNYPDGKAWVKNDLEVTFGVYDAADSFGKGVSEDTITITGELTNTTYKAKATGNTFTGDDNKVYTLYSFDADCKQDYVISAKDASGQETEKALRVKAEDILIDKSKPVIFNFTYDYPNSDTWKQKEEGVNISFSVHDRRTDIKDSTEWLSGKDKDDKCTMTVKVEGEKSGYLEFSSSVYDADNDCFNFTFNTKELVGEDMLGQYQTYTVTAQDPATNSDSKTTETAKVDEYPPEITEVSFTAEPKDAGSRILHFLTFGLYSNNVIVMTVKAKDDSVSSNIKSIVAKYADGKEEITPVKDSFKSDYKDLVASAEAKFQLKYFDIEDVKKGNINPLDGAGIRIEVIDNALYSTGEKTLYTIKEENKLKTDNNVSFDDNFEIAASNVQPEYNNYSIVSVKGKDPYIANGEKWFPGNVAVKFDVSEKMTKIHSVNVSLNGENITEYCDATINGKIEKLKEEYTNYENGSPSAKVEAISIAFNTETPEINKYLKDTDRDGAVKDTGENKIVVTVESNNGESKTLEEYFYVDNTAPLIDRITFADGKSEDEKTLSNVVKTTYGYYFKDETTVTVTASDIGCGVNNIYLKAVPSTDEYGTKGYNDKEDEDDIPCTPIDANTATCEIKANFKGQLIAYAVDNIDNKSLYYSPDGLVVESELLHPSVSGAEIEILSSPVNKDQDGVDLFDSSVKAKLTIYDLYSGLKDVTYSIKDSADSESWDLDTSKTVPGQTSVGDWIVEDRDSNIVTRISKIITISSADYNDNGIEIELKGTDRAGFAIKEDTKKISIDVTKPTVKVVYSPAIDSAFHRNDNYYFNKVRTATITVTERNFNPNDFDMTKYIAIEGTRPDLVGTSNWSTSYALVNASGEEQRTAEHTAEITFSQDGKYEVDFDYTDLAGNAANKDFQKETFYIDMTKPVMTVSLDNNASPRYYQSNRATIKIVEHNFDPSAEYLVYDASATGPDNMSPATPPQISSWSSSGDEHTATINYDDSNQGKHNFKITYKDLADNAADDHTEDTFYIDHTANKPTFENVTRKAYSGNIAPIVQFDDYNFNEAPTGSVITLTRHAYDFDKMQQLTDKVEYTNTRSIKYASNSDAIGATVTYANFDKKEIVDGVYNLNASYTDKAGNEASDSITFSVNRFGSVFVLGSAQTTSLVDMVYTKDAPDVVIREISAVPHINGAASLSYNSSNKDLNEKSNEYKVSSPNSAGEWYEYMYQIFASNFEKEGEYTVTVSSKYKIDEKETTVTNRTADTSGDVERNCPVSFVVDKTSPTVSITGVDENGFYSEAEKTLHIVCSDDNIDKDSLSITLDGHAVNLEESKAVVDDSLFGELDIELPIAADGHETKHSIKVDVKDYALNSGDNAVNAFTLSATFLTMFFHNTVALIVTGVVLAALIALAILLVVKKRKNSTN